MAAPSLRRLASTLLVGLLCLPLPGLCRAAASEAGVDALRERAEEVYHESVSREDMAAAAAAFASALDDVETALAEAGPEALVARLVFLDQWVDKAGWPAAVGPVKEELVARATGYARELLEMLRSGEVPEEAWGELHRRTRFVSRPQLLALWLGSEPQNLRLLAALAETSSEQKLRLALFRAASATLAPAKTEDEEVLARLFLQERVRALLGMGLAEEALQELEAAPERRSRHLLSPPETAPDPVELEVPGEPVLLEHRDLRLDLAAAYALRGETARAAELLTALEQAASRPEAAEQPRVILEDGLPGSETPALQRRSLEWLLSLSGAVGTAPPEEDPFDHFMDLLAVRDHSYGPRPLWRRLEAELAEISGYPDLAAHLLAEACRWLGPDFSGYEVRKLTALGPLPDSVAPELDAVDAARWDASSGTAAAIDRVGSSLPWVREAACPAPEAAVSMPDPARAILPAGAELEVLRVRGDLPEKFAASTLATSASDVVLPGETPPVAVFRQQGELLALTLPEPPGHSLGQDYLVFRSEDGGATWGAPHATGIGVLSPFEIVAGSPRNRRSGGDLLVEAVLWSRSETLPGLEKGARVLLTLPVETLLADSDGDGLTDREERAILTDPREADTDRDGVDDGFDRLTRLGAAGSADPDTERVVTLVVEEVLFPRRRSAPGVDCAADDSGAEGPIPSWQTAFVAGAGIPLRAPSRPERVVQLDGPPPADLGPAFRVHLFFFDHARTRAFVAWRVGDGRSWQGRSGRHLLVRSDRPEGWRLSKGVSSGGCMTVFEDYDSVRLVD